jgi:sugar phosphate isomerase/epimerase
MKLDFEKSIRAYYKSGYEAAGITFDKLIKYGIDNAKKLLKKIPLEITHASFLGPFNQTTENEYNRARKEDIKRINMASELGIKCILAITGPIKGLEQKQGERQLVRGLRDIGYEAEEFGIKIGLEPMHYIYKDEWTFIYTLSKALEIINCVNLSSLGVFFDTYHLWQEPGLINTIKKADGKIVGCHISDWRPITRSLSDRVLMGDGCIPLKEILKALEEAGWDKWYDVEIYSEELWNMDTNKFLKKCKNKFNKLWE